MSALADVAHWRRVAEANSTPCPNLGCLLWLGGASNGYAIVYVPEIRERVQLNRLVLGLRPGDGLVAAHSCDQRMCVRHSHLFVATYAANTEDARRKDRLARGDARRPKLTLEQVAEIRASLRDGMKQRPIADAYGLSLWSVSAIATGRTWRAARTEAF